MKFSQQWLQELVKTKLTTESLVNQLTMAGLEVDKVEPVAGKFTNVVVGKVLDVAPHPNADKLQICTVDIGKSEKLNIVCGAKNVRKNLKVAVAQIGAILPGDFKIKKAKLRGVESCGMLCSEKELGLAETSAGIMELPTDAPVSKNVINYLNLDDVTITIDLTPNRGDCASLIGIAREVSAINKCKYYLPKIKTIKPVVKDSLAINLAAPKECSRYVGRVIRDINLKASTPLWMQERLRRSGIRSIDPIVDVTNYVLLELGQPMHAFDLANISQGINIRLAKKGEQLTLLDETKISLTPQDLVIADHKQPVALAGVMGGLNSGITPNTRDIFLESAFFDPIKIAATAKHYNLQTDSSYRFERGVDYKLQVKAMELAAQLLLDIVGGKPGPVIEKYSREFLPKPAKIKLRLSRIEKMLGIKIPTKTVYDILQRLGMLVKKSTKICHVTIPSHRFDCTIEIDLIEELARIYGYENIPARTYAADLVVPPISATKTPTQIIRELLQARDYHEVITYSFVDPKMQQLLDPEQTPIALTNPIANNMSVMRTNLWPGLLETLIYNLNRQQERIRLFEIGLRFCKAKGKLQQQRVIAGIAYGAVYSEQWGENKRLIDFYDVKADLESLGKFTFHPHSHAALHPGKSAQICKSQKPIGYLGVLHPNIAGILELKHEVILFELLLDEVQQKAISKYQPISKYPAIRRDLAFLAKKEISAAQIKAIIEQKAGKLLTDLIIFDVYQSKDISAEQKSIALGLTLQDASRTLNDSEVNELLTEVITSLEEKLGLELRK
ncbi:MAG: phenylalanine--tRNA ligase subunit beta [Gammaproteobacteria bacterium]|jgi:phenylalanyl-tRNA synthetase beta chain